jgi:catechol 2,3-dioxygenase-like lactoylglutathione lyase family enzyme
MPSNIAYVSIGVADMALAERLWVEQLGLEVVARRQGPDQGLGRLWKIPATQIVDQLLLGTPGADTGRLHFVQFKSPAAAVRADAAPTDLGAKNIDVNCVDMPVRVEELGTAGYSFRSAIGDYEIDGIRAREVQLPAHDALNVVLIEVLSKGFEVQYTAQGYAALTSFVVIVPDVEREQKFYKNLFGMEDILVHELSGAAVEMAAGLPKGTVLDLRLLGSPDNLFGRMELIEYIGATSANLFSSAKPPATGILRCGFAVESIDGFLALTKAQAIPVLREVEVDAICGRGHMVELVSPAGLHIEVLQQA